MFLSFYDFFMSIKPVNIAKLIVDISHVVEWFKSVVSGTAGKLVPWLISPHGDSYQQNKRIQHSDGPHFDLPWVAWWIISPFEKE
jgi:hypothetical protein